MATTKRKLTMLAYLKIKAFVATGSFDVDFSKFDEDFLNSVGYMSIYLPKGREQAILDFIKKNEKERKMKEIMEYAEFQQFKAMQNKSQSSQQVQADAQQADQPAQDKELTVEEMDKMIDWA